MKQRSLRRAVSVRGQSLHTGVPVTLTLQPAPVDQGVIFRRLDLPAHPTVRPRADLVTDVVRATTLSEGAATVHTVEHVLSALHGLGVDNVTVELDGPEPPILDGSAAGFVRLVLEGEPFEQESERRVLRLTEPVSVSRGASSLVALPYDGLRISCTSADDRGYHTQHLELTIDPDVYATQVAPARTFTIFEDIEELLRAGKIRGGSLENAVVIKAGGQIESSEPLRFRDEFVRHKILDLIGDLFLLGAPLHAHIVALRPGHAANCELVRAIGERLARAAEGPRPGRGRARIRTGADLQAASFLDIQEILAFLPHRYPFILIDRILEFRGEDEAVALKNVTINEPYFMGHFPGSPVMPGVLQVEAMAQTAGILMLRKIGRDTKLAYFMSADRVKFRRAVRPGDQLMLHVKLTKSRAGRIGVAEAEARVDGQVVSSAELMFTLVDAVDET